jgi:hypothetical protein
MHSKLSLVLLIAITSCSFPVPQKFVKQFDCYSGKSTGLDTIINIHGYYRRLSIIDNRGSGLSTWKNGKLVEVGIDTSYHDLVFFKDGIFLNGVAAPKDNMEQTFVQKALSGEHLYAYLQGTYTIQGDTIKTKTIIYGKPNDHWFGYERWYKIVDKNTIVDFYSAQLALPKDKARMAENQPRFYTVKQPFNFVPVARMPKSYSWLMEEKWFPCDSIKSVTK